MKIVNTSRREIGVPGIAITVLKPRQEMPVSAFELEELKRQPQFQGWLLRGMVEIHGGEAVNVPAVPDERPGPELPEGLTGKGTEIYAHLNKSGRASGWYSVYHEGMPCTDEKVRKERAEEIAAEYE